MEDFEHRYQWYLDLLQDDHRLDIAELQTVEQQLRRLNHDFEYADLTSDSRLALIKSRNEAMTLLAAATHRARIDDACAVHRSVAAQLAPAQEQRHCAGPQPRARQD